MMGEAIRQVRSMRLIPAHHTLLLPLKHPCTCPHRGSKYTPWPSAAEQACISEFTSTERHHEKSIVMRADRPVLQSPAQTTDPSTSAESRQSVGSVMRVRKVRFSTLTKHATCTRAARVLGQHLH